MKMKKNYLFIIVVLLTMTIGCTNSQNSSMEEAIFVAQKLPNFKKNIQYFSISSGYSFIAPEDPFINKSLPEKQNKDILFVHIVIYEKKQGGQEIVFLDDSRPPKIVLKQSSK